MLVNADRKATKISDLRGKPTVLAFFPGAFTGVCTTEMCTFRDDMSVYASLSAQVIGISVDSPYAQKAFADQNRLTLQFLSDYNRQAVRAFGVEDPNFAGGLLPGVAMRSVFVLDPNGVVRYKWVAPTQATLPDFKAVEAAIKALGR
jgi:peroxiredoxin